MEEFALYVHIPFCTKKCGYCDFFSVEKNSAEDSYIFSLANEAAFYKKKYGITSFKTIYIGGGTPSILSAEQLALLLDLLCGLSVEKPAEITVEMNPESVDEKKILALKNRATRISLGIQSLTQSALFSAERKCTAETAAEKIALVKSLWKNSLSLDCIAGLPCQTDAEFSSSLEKMISFSPDHFSLYTLTVENGTTMEKKIRGGKIQFDEETADSQWILGRDILCANGFSQYEVSNFCKKGAESLHNLFYWRQKNYVGVGAGATGTVFGEKSIRWTNGCNVSRYENFWKEKNPSEKIAEEKIPRSVEEISLETREFEFLMMGLRTKFGVNSAEYEKKFSSVEPWRGNLRNRLFKAGEKNFSARENADGSADFSLTAESVLFLNRILLDLL